MNDDLVDLGDALESALARHIDTQSAPQRNTVTPERHIRTIQPMEEPMPNQSDHPLAPRGRRNIIIAGAVAVTLLSAGAVAAGVGFFSDDVVERGITHSNLLFAGTTPECTGDGVVFDCTLTAPPHETSSDPDAAGYPDDYLGSIWSFTDENLIIAGGCIGTNSQGTAFTCYAGDRAVEEGLIGADYLGEYEPFPGVG